MLRSEFEKWWEDNRQRHPVPSGVPYADVNRLLIDHGWLQEDPHPVRELVNEVIWAAQHRRIDFNRIGDLAGKAREWLEKEGL